MKAKKKSEKLELLDSDEIVVNSVKFQIQFDGSEFGHSLNISAINRGSETTSFTVPIFTEELDKLIDLLVRYRKRCEQ